jgi:hypothetical protein
MKPLSVFFVAMLFVLVPGCDDDGTTTDTEETETFEETKAPITIDSGSDTVGPRETLAVPFSVSETGIIEGRVEWSAGPPQLQIALMHAGGSFVEDEHAESPLTLQMEATQDLLDDSNDWELQLYNAYSNLEATVDYTIRFTPD